MTLRKKLHGYAGILVLGSALSAPVLAQSASELMVEMHSDSDEFYLFDQSDIELLDYQEAREVRICADKRKHMVPLKVKYDAKEAKVRPGDCFRFEAKNVSVSPSKSLEANWDLSGTVETREVGS